MVLVKLGIQMQMKLDLNTISKPYSKWIKDANIRTKTIQLLEETEDKNVTTLDLGKNSWKSHESQWQ